MNTSALQWLSERGASFALPFERSKNKFEKDWPNKPHSVEEAIQHAQNGGNVGILTGKHSANIVAIDRDIDFDQTVDMLGDLGKTAKIVRSNAPGRGKFLYRINGEIPPTTSWRPKEEKKHPHAELLGDNGQRHALCPPSEIDGGHYELIDTQYDILTITAHELDYIWRLITGGSIYKEERASEEAQADKANSNAFVRTVKEAWTVRSVFEHFAKDQNGIKKDGTETRVLGNGGLLIGADGSIWYAYADSIGGDVLDAWAWCKWGVRVNRQDAKMFWDVINDMAEAKGISRPIKPLYGATMPGGAHTNGTNGHNGLNGDNGTVGTLVPAYALPVFPGDVVRRNYLQLLEAMYTKALASYNEAFVIACMYDGEEGDARLLDSILHGSIVFDHSEGLWFYYNNLFWEPDRTWNIYQLVSDVLSESYRHLSVTKHAQSIDLERTLAGNDNATQEQRDELKRVIAISKAAKSRSVDLNNINDVKRVLNFAASGLRLGISGDEWDTKANLLGTQNAIIDLTTGKPVQPEANQYIRTVAPVSYVQGATCPTWEKSLIEIFDGDGERSAYVKRFLGYAMSGACTESTFPIWYGKEGRNGKEFILERIRNVLGDKLAGVAESELLLSSKSERGKNSSTEGLMVLRGRRIAWASETNEGRMLDLASMKDLSGGHILTGRHNHGRQVEWKRTHTLVLLTNHRPHINSQALAEWDRVRLLEFPLSFVNEPDPEKPNQRLKDKTLGDRIDRDELSGLLNWLIDGCLEWRKSGLGEPEAVKRATARYREDEDTLGFFLKETCVISPGCKVKPVELYRVYIEWLEKGSKPMGKKTFYNKIEERGFKRSASMGIEYFQGIGIVAV